jgi:hypothetical protein
VTPTGEITERGAAKVFFNAFGCECDHDAEARRHRRTAQCTINAFAGLRASLMCLDFGG